MRKKNFSTILIYIALFIWAIGTIFPFAWVFINSFKTREMIAINSFSIPFGDSFTLDNYINAVNSLEIFKAYKNSLIISISAVIGTVVVSIFAAFAMARYNFYGKKIFYFLMVACMMIPVFAIIFPLIKTIYTLKLHGTYLSVILPQMAGNISFTTILLMGFMKSLPLEVEESAYLDGANVFQVIWHLIVPMSKSSIATASIFVFLWSYNDLFLQMLILPTDKMPICTLLSMITTKEFGTDHGLLVAAVSLICVPVLIVYFFLQKHIIKGLTAGAVKG